MDNDPNLWVRKFPFPQKTQHKYNRGHVVVSGGGVECTGAACLAAKAALRAGAGLVTILSPWDALAIYAAKLNSVMAKPFNNIDEFKEFIQDSRKNTVLIGPGNGVNELTAQKLRAALYLGKNCVIDADAITIFQGRSQELFQLIKSPTIITPHEGEFKSLFNISGSREAQAKEAARQSGAVIVFKGSDTVIAAPDGRLVINRNAPPHLATAGSGDVLAGIIAGIMASNMDYFWAACSAVWLHSKAAELVGIGLIADDLTSKLPDALKYLYQHH